MTKKNSAGALTSTVAGKRARRSGLASPSASERAIATPRTPQTRAAAASAIAAIALFLLSALLLTGCDSSASSSGGSTQQSVSDVMQSQMQDGEEQEVVEQEAFVGDSEPAFENVDYDLTAMTTEMSYATVSDMMANADQYKGKIVKVKGPFYHSYQESIDRNYSYVTIQDVTACCGQWLEFAWLNEPTAFPENDAEVVVTGKFGTYEEKGVEYVHLEDASVELGAGGGSAASGSSDATSSSASTSASSAPDAASAA